jgi:hypothetical protein
VLRSHPETYEALYLVPSVEIPTGPLDSIMPVGIMQVLNNVNAGVGYRNGESAHSFSLPIQTLEKVKEGVLPSSKSWDDKLPWYNLNDDTKHIEFTVGNARLRLCEHKGQFRFDYLVEKSWFAKSFGTVFNAEKYVLKLDGYQTQKGGQGLSVIFYKYDDMIDNRGDHVSRELVE